MASKTVVKDVPPWLRVYDDGTVERLVGTETTPPTHLDPQTGVSSRDVVLSSETGVTARIYHPSDAEQRREKLPLVVYFHGGAFCVSSAADPLYQNMLNLLVQRARVVLVSVDYRRAPESPLPTAYDDSWAAIQWVAGQAPGRAESLPGLWIAELADFGRVFLAGDSAGGNITHHMAMRAGLESPGMDISGALMVHPYFWGEEPIGAEAESPVFKAMVDDWWLFVCQSGRRCDDPMINPLADGAWVLEGLGCGKALVCVAGNDILRERGRLYHLALEKIDWVGKAEFYETEGEDHVFFVLDPTTENAHRLIKRLAEFINVP